MSSVEGIFVCRSTVLFEHDGVEVAIRRGATVRAGHPIMKGREDMFEPLVVEYDYEQPKPRARAATKGA